MVRALGAAGAATAPQDPGCGTVDPGCGLSISAEIPWRSLAEEQGYPEAGRSTDKHWDGGMPQELAVPWNAPGPGSSMECPRTWQMCSILMTKDWSNHSGNKEFWLLSIVINPLDVI